MDPLGFGRDTPGILISMGRRLRYMVGVVGLVGLIVSAGAWWFGHFYNGHFVTRVPASEGNFILAAEYGKFYVAFTWDSHLSDPTRTYVLWWERMDRSGTALMDHALLTNQCWLLGWGWDPGRVVSIRVSAGLMVFVFACLIAIGLLGILWRRRHRPAHTCSTCAYDLRGNPAATACPECGADISSPSSAVPGG